ncbi:hypothetical protein AB1Y20_021766 [Prymnesium parvum]
MLEAERQALKWEAYHASLDIIEREMTVLLQFLSNIGTVGTLIAGFTWAGFSDEYMPEHMSETTEIFFMGFITLAFGSMVSTVFASMATSTLGPALALKGVDGTAMRRAVERMKLERRRALTAFTVGGVSFAAAFLVLIWAKLEYLSAKVLCTLLWCACAATMIWMTRSSVLAFCIPEASPITNQGVVQGVDFVRKADQAATNPAQHGRVALRQVSGSSLPRSTCSTNASVH